MQKNNSKKNKKEDRNITKLIEKCKGTELRRKLKLIKRRKKELKIKHQLVQQEKILQQHAKRTEEDNY